MTAPHDKREDVVRVDFDFRRELSRKVEGNLASYCYQCGACVGDCPATTYGSGFNPREIMLKVLYGLGHELLREDSVLWQCTNCYNCHERCPQGVKPVEVIISLKNMLADRGIYPPTVAKVIETFEKTGRTVPLTPAVDRQRERFGLPPMKAAPVDEIRALRDDSAAVAGERTAPRVGDSVKAAASNAETGVRRFAFFPGCLIPARYPAMEFAIRETLPRLGIEIVDLDDASCCPDPIYFKSKDKVAWLSVAARNLALAEAIGLDVITNCSGCTATLSETYHLLQDGALRARVNERLSRVGREYRGTSRVRHIATVVRDEIGYDRVRDTVVHPLDGLRVAIHYGCHLLKPSRVMGVDDPNDPSMLEKLVEALGATPVRHRNWSLCCGKACQSEDIPSNMMRDLLGTVHEERADLLCLICPTCFGQFDHGQAKVAQQFHEDFHTPSIYYFQLLAFAQGVPYERLGFDRSRFKPECLRRF
jgi:heterodisulfide reductase subunit B